MKITVLHGPNLNLLGTRQPEYYGTLSLADIDEKVTARCGHHGVSVACHQYNGEGPLIDAVHQSIEGDGLLINPGAYAHTSLALADALECLQIPIIEVHLSNVHARDAMRHKMLTARAVSGVITGLKANSYLLGVDALVSLMKRSA